MKILSYKGNVDIILELNKKIIDYNHTFPPREYLSRAISYNDFRREFDKYGEKNDFSTEKSLIWNKEKLSELNQKILDKIYKGQLQFISKNLIPI